MQCDICGREKQLYKAMVEGSELTVCEECGAFGNILKKVAIAPLPKKPAAVKKPETKKEDEVIEAIVPDYAKKIRAAREKLGLSQEDFAKKISEKESLVHKLETGAFEPGIGLARKLERLLKIKLVEAVKEDTAGMPKGGRKDMFTIGDVIKIK